MPRVSKVTKTPPTIRQRASEEDDKTLTGAPEPSVQTSTETNEFKTDQEVIVTGFIPIAPLLTFHLRRVENELTDTMRTVHIPSPASIQPGERVVIHVYREE